VLGIFAGLVVAWQLGVFRSVTWAVGVFPAVLVAKAVMNSTFSGRLNTALHVGTLTPNFLGNTGLLGRMFQRIVALTLMTSVVISIASTILGILFWGTTAADLPAVLVVVVATMSLGLTLYLFTIPVAFAVLKKGLDLDSVSYPVAASIADVFITVCYALAVNLFLNFGLAGKCTVIGIALVPFALGLYFLPRRIGEKGVSQTVKTSLLALTLVAVVASVTGTILQEISAVVSVTDGNGVVFIAAVLAAYPAIIELVSDAALFIGSTATTRLVLGLLEPYFLAVKNHAVQILGAWAASAIAFVPLSGLALALTGTFSLRSFYALTCVLLATNVLALFAMVLISYALAILTFKKGLDPDHLVVPVETSLAAAMTSIALLAALFMLLHPWA